jgi:hypothetical protein
MEEDETNDEDLTSRKEEEKDDEDMEDTETRDEQMEDYEEDYEVWSTRASFDRFSMSACKVMRIKKNYFRKIESREKSNAKTEKEN